MESVTGGMAALKRAQMERNHQASQRVEDGTVGMRMPVEAGRVKGTEIRVAMKEESGRNEREGKTEKMDERQEISIGNVTLYLLVMSIHMYYQPFMELSMYDEIAYR